MCETHWWSNGGPFQPWKRCPARPDPVAVLLCYLEKRGIEPEEYVAYLMDLLDLQKSMAYNILKGEGFDSISRCRLLVQALKIPPPLLGIDGKYSPIEQHPYWWQASGFPFHADAQGYPVMSEVVAYLRKQRIQTAEGGGVKVWSQEDLGDATGLKKETIYRMEHDRNPLVLESMSRRVMVASALGTLAAENEPTIFRLFGLDPHAYGVPVPAHESVPLIYLPHPLLSEEILQRYHREQATFFAEYDTCHAQNTVEKALERIQYCQVLLSRTLTTTQILSVLTLASRYQQLLLLIANEQQKSGHITFNAKEAVKLAEYATTLPEAGEQAIFHASHELLAAALCRTALAYSGLDQYEVAQASIQRALHVLPIVQSRQLKTAVLLDAALIHAHLAKGVMDQQMVLSYLNRADRLTPPSQLLSPFAAPDDHFIRCSTSLLYLRKAMALSAPQMKGATNEKVSDLLKDAQRLTPPELIRQRVIIEVFQAQAHFTAGEYQEATEVALSALEKSQQIRSRLNRNRIERLYHQCLHTSYRDKPLLAYLGMKLRTWDHGMD